MKQGEHTMYKWIMSTLVVIACGMGVFLLATSLPAKPVSDESELAEGQQLLKIQATSFEYNEKEFHVKAGQNYLIKFSNKLGNHGAAIKELGLDFNADNPKMSYTFKNKGTYEMHCSIMCGQGHAGMMSKIIVE
jgi:cytochrome c oxidase subunit 2